MKKIPIICLIFIYVSCSTDNDVQTVFDPGYNYLPILAEGSVLTYEVNEKSFSNGGVDMNEETFFLRKELIVSKKNEDQGGYMRFDNYRSITGNEPWTYIGAEEYDINNIHSVHTTTEKDQIINITFPIEIGKSWDGLAFMSDDLNKNLNGESIAYYEGWDFQVYSIEDIEKGYENVVTVSFADYENAISRRKVEEKYAHDVGLIFQEVIILDTQCIAECQDLSWDKKAHSGISLTRELISIQ